MRIYFTAIGCLLYSFLTSCNPQPSITNMKTDKNPLICDVKTGLCEAPNHHHSDSTSTTHIHKKPLKVIYFTDPICSSCWGIEPQLKKLKLEYGNAIDIEYCMGGLLPDWSYNSGGISQPSDVAHHWDDVSAHYQMPIDGDVWLEDPLYSSYPPSIAFKAAQLQDQNKALVFLRKIREMVFLSKKNITKWDYLEQAAKVAELDLEQFKQDYENQAVEEFHKDLALSKKLGVRGFPTLFFSNEAHTQITLYGFRPYHAFQHAVSQLYPQIKKQDIDTSWENLFKTFKTLTAKEFSVLTDLSLEESEKTLQNLTKEQKLEQLETKNGSLWILLDRS